MKSMDDNLPSPPTPETNIPTPPLPPEAPKKSLVLPVAIIILLTITLFSLAGVFIYKNSFQKQPTPVIPPTITRPSPAPKPITLSLESPNQGSVVVNNQIKVRGQTLPNTTVVFYTDTDQNSVESDSNGRFEGTISLVSGINSLTVAAYQESGEEKSITIDLVYDSELSEKP